MYAVFFQWQGYFRVVTYRIWEVVCYKVLPLVFEKKLDRDNSLAFIVSPLLSAMVDQASP